jgi:hypothetical protein
LTADKREEQAMTFGDVEVMSVYTHDFGTHFIKAEEIGKYDKLLTCVEHGCKPATHNIIYLEGEYDKDGVRKLITDLTAAVDVMDQS